MKVSEYQEKILAETGLKTTVSKMSGSMKHHLRFMPMFQGGGYPNFPFEWAQEQSKLFKSNGHGVFCTTSNFNIPAFNFSEYDPIKYQKERKPKPIDENTPSKEWGSKNSQIRLDKAAARYAKGLRRGENRARYY